MSSSFMFSASGMLLGACVALTLQLLFGRMNTLQVFLWMIPIAGLVILIGTGSAEQLAYAIWPALKPETRLIMTRQLESRLDTHLGLMLIGAPIALALFFVWWRYGSTYAKPALMLGALTMTVLVVTPIPAKLARAVLSDEVVDDLSRQLATKLERR